MGTKNKSKTEILRANLLSKIEMEGCEFEAIDYLKYLVSIVQVNVSSNKRN